VGALEGADPDALHRRIAQQDPAALRRWSLDQWRAKLGLADAAPADPRAAEVAARLFADPCALPSLAEAARLARLSPSRFHALFRTQAGVPFRRYRLWRRMGHVMASLASGANLTVAAHEAGFASSAHFSDQFRRLFGLKPSALVALGPEIRWEAASTASSRL
jgi:AraC-like DNA-binding protein